MSVKQRSIKMDDSLATELASIAKKEERTVSSLIRHACKLYIAGRDAKKKAEN